jgi:Pentapeptide repeats (8 copies)
MPLNTGLFSHASNWRNPSQGRQLFCFRGADVAVAIATLSLRRDDINGPGRPIGMYDGMAGKSERNPALKRTRTSGKSKREVKPRTPSAAVASKMTTSDAVKLLRSGARGVAEWNAWRRKFGNGEPPVKLCGVHLDEVWLEKVAFYGVDLTGASLKGASLRGANLNFAILNDASLRSADLLRASLNRTQLKGADLAGASLYGTNLRLAKLAHANLTGATLDHASITRADLANAKLDGCRVYGISVWDVDLSRSSQKGLIITPSGEPAITVDNLKVAQFIYLLLENPEIRDVIDTITSKVVLILGRFTSNRKPVLDKLRDKLRTKGYSPILFDFEKPAGRSYRETVSTLAHMARFVVADITDAKVVLQELERIVPSLPSVPVQPIQQRNTKGTIIIDDDYRPYPWFLPTVYYQANKSLAGSSMDNIIQPAERMLARRNRPS